ncbi:hypothetical protein scyTo_0000766 [Scyliorhinus torazame]|uniref:Uncharacterized protein n=1 Tax=Scyliorhinus torazame TaxID=75743 RepID=A0A401P3V3_SCYTO|nr:hypothetical protein [Scyliorhinus torazame]
MRGPPSREGKLIGAPQSLFALIILSVLWEAELYRVLAMWLQHPLQSTDIQFSNDKQLNYTPVLTWIGSLPAFIYWTVNSHAGQENA